MSVVSLTYASKRITSLLRMIRTGSSRAVLSSRGVTLGTSPMPGLYFPKSLRALPPWRRERLLMRTDFCQETRLKSATGNPRIHRRCSAEPRLGYAFPVTNGQRNGRARKTLYAPLFLHFMDILTLEVSGSSTARPNLKRLDLYPSLTGPVFFVTLHLRPFSLSMLTISSKVVHRLTSPKDGDS